MAAPTVVVYKNAYGTDTQGTPDIRALTQITVATGDVIAVVAHCADYASGPGHVISMAKTAGTATISTPVLQQEAGTTSQCGCELLTCTVSAGGTLTLTLTFSITNSIGRCTAWTYVATGCTGLGNTGKTTASTLPTASLVTSANSYVIAMAADWAATGSATTTMTPAGYTLDAHETDGVADQGTAGIDYSSRGGHWASVSAGTVAYGIASPSSGTALKYGLVVCELKGAGGTDAAVTMGSALAIVTAQPVPQPGSLSGPAYATAEGTVAGGTGSWSGTANAGGAPDGSYATWAVT